MQVPPLASARESPWLEEGLNFYYYKLFFEDPHLILITDIYVQVYKQLVFSKSLKLKLKLFIAQQQQ